MNPWEHVIARHLERIRHFPPLKPTSIHVQYAVECILCGQRRGLHRFGDECCPNPRWIPGGGEQQWLSLTYTPRAA